MKEFFENAGFSAKSIIAGLAITTAGFAALLTSGPVTLLLIWAAIGSVLWLAD